MMVCGQWAQQQYLILDQSGSVGVFSIPLQIQWKRTHTLHSNGNVYKNNIQQIGNQMKQHISKKKNEEEEFTAKKRKKKHNIIYEHWMWMVNSIQSKVMSQVNWMEEKIEKFSHHRLWIIICARCRVPDVRSSKLLSVVIFLYYLLFVIESHSIPFECEQQPNNNNSTFSFCNYIIMK